MQRARAIQRPSRDLTTHSVEDQLSVFSYGSCAKGREYGSASAQMAFSVKQHERSLADDRLDRAAVKAG
jgi:hypothetical protein